LGIDVIVGNHAHVPHPVSLPTSENDDSQKTLCLYSTGNALSNQRLGNISYVKTAHTEDGILFSFSFAKYSDGTVRVENVELLPLWVNMYTSKETNKVVYDILPLDDQVEDWKTQFNLTDKTLKQAEDSLARTTKIVGEGLQEVNAYLKSLPPVK
jgi:poly-gamma-glutamate synthesis protein (capsule biosynthesis protein)